MSRRWWFSAKVRLVVETDRRGWLHYADSVFVFRAKDYDEAFKRAIVLGRSREESYKNEEGDRVCWRLKEILTLDRIKSRSLDGAEVLYESPDIPKGGRRRSGLKLHPEKSEPRETF